MTRSEPSDPGSRQRGRDEIDNAAVREAWQRWSGRLPDAAEARVARGEVFYSALDLAEHLIPPAEFVGWRISFTSDGGPYAAVLLLRDGRGGPSEISATDPTSLTLALIAAIAAWTSQTWHPSLRP
jgi:hypothetical protein